MPGYISNDTIRSLREAAQLTQKQLADELGVTDKAISKWETGRGLPDVTLLDPLSKALNVSIAELLAGERIVNTNKAANLNKSRFYVCPICGNVLYSSGEATISCCGTTLPPLEPEDDTGEAPARIEISDGEVYVAIDHAMQKDHFVSFLAYVTTDHHYLRKLYPEQRAEARFPYKGSGTIYSYCNRHGLSAQKIRKPPARVCK